jgi:imidazole glycerol-phosphate synthase subunit HisH
LGAADTGWPAIWGHLGDGLELRADNSQSAPVSSSSVLVLDYAVARSRRLLLALQAAGIDAKLAESPNQVKSHDHVIVPDGDDDDGSLARGVSGGIVDAIGHHVDAQRPLLCIGMGMVFLMHGRAAPNMPAGLGLFAVPVQRFDSRMTDDGERPLLVPHVGRSVVVGLERHPTLRSLVSQPEHGVWPTFRHRLCAPARIPQADVAVSHHGVPFAGAVWKQSVLAVQFLPEHSARFGIDVLRTWRGIA